MSTAPTMIAGTNTGASAGVVREKLHLRLRVSTAQDFSVDVALEGRTGSRRLFADGRSG